MVGELDYVKYLGMIILRAEPESVKREVSNKLLVHINKNYYIVNLPRVLKFTENIMVIDSLLKKYPSKFEPFYSHPIITLFYKKIFKNFPDKFVVKDNYVRRVFEKYYGFQGIDYVSVVRKFLSPATNHECVVIIKELGYIYLPSVHYCNKYFGLKLTSYSTLNYVPTTMKVFGRKIMNYFKNHIKLVTDVEVHILNTFPITGVMITKNKLDYLIFGYDDEIYNEKVLIDIYDSNINPVRVVKKHTTIPKLKSEYCNSRKNQLHLFHINSFKELILYNYNTGKFTLLIVDDMKEYLVRKNYESETVAVRIRGEKGKEIVCNFKRVTGNSLDNSGY